MNAKDWKIISILRSNSRESLTNISKATKIPISTVYERLKTHSKKLITKYTAIIDFSKLGYNARASIIVKVRKQNRNDFREFIKCNENVNTAYKINNSYDFFLDVIFRDIKELEDFIELLEEKFNIQSKLIFYVIDDIKKEEFLSAKNFNSNFEKLYKQVM